MTKIAQFKIDPTSIRVVQPLDESGRLFFYRDSGLMSHDDGLGRPSGVMTALGLAFVPQETPWIPSAMTFSTDTARPVAFEIPDDDKLRFIIAGILIGERYVRVNRKGKLINVADGRMDDRKHAEYIWKGWLRWCEAGRPSTAARFILGKSKLRFGEDEPIAKTLQRLGLPFS
jgi:hypothetical protein